MANTIILILSTLQPYIIYIAIAAITFLASRTRLLRGLLWTPVVILSIYLICLFAATVAQL